MAGVGGGTYSQAVPEGHTVHRIAQQLGVDFVGRRVAVSSPQGRFEVGAALLDGATLSGAQAVGKHLLMTFAHEPSAAGVVPEQRYLRVHLGLYGAWDFHGRISPLGRATGPAAFLGAPRRAVRMGEGERSLPAVVGEVPDDVGGPGVTWPPEPVGQVRVRLQTGSALADLRGPNACEVVTADDVAALLAAAGPDPRVDAWPDPEGTFVQRLTARRSPVGLLLMDQSVVSGIGNIYRAELLFRARLEPHVLGRDVPPAVAAALWADWAALLDDGVRTGVMLTRADLDDDGRAAALADPSLRHGVYGRAGEPCLVCGTRVRREQMAGRTLYWCPRCQKVPRRRKAR